MKGENKVDIQLANTGDGYRFWIGKWCFAAHSHKRSGFGAFIAYSERYFDGKGMGWPPSFLIGFYAPIKFWETEIYLIWKALGIRTPIGNLEQ